MQQRINDLSRQLEATKVELQSRKSRSERTEHGMQSQLDELRGSYSILEAEYNGIQGHIDGYRHEAEAAKEEAKKHAITASEVILIFLQNLKVRPKKERLSSFMSFVH